MGNLGPTEIILILLVLVLLFGAKKLPEMARSVGRAQGEFKKGLKEGAVDESTSSTPPTDSTEPKTES